MHILVIVPEAFKSTGGIPLWNKIFLKALSEISSESGIILEVLSLNDSTEQRDEKYLSKGISFQGLSRNKTKMAFLSLLKSFKADMVIFGHINIAPLGLFLKMLRPKLKYGVIIYGIEVWEMLPFVKRLSARRADFVFSISRFTAEKLAELNGVAKEKIHILANCLNPFLLSNRDTPTINHSLSKRRILLTVARLASSERYKGIDHVITAMPRVLSVFPDASYIVVGKGDDRERLQALSRDLGVSEHVIFTGYVSDEELPGYYRNCDVFLLPSEKEGFGFVLLEAMAFKKPCIGANSGGIPEVIVDNETGVLVEYGDVKAIGNAIISLLSDRATRESLGEEGYKRLIDKLTFGIYKDTLLHLIENVRV